MSKDTQLRYKTARTMQQLCGLLQIDPAAVLRRMRFPPDHLENEGRGVTAQEYFAGWDALLAEAAREDAPLFLGQAYARGPFNPAFFAFTCSPTVAVGLERLALFKPLTGPLFLGLSRDADRALTIQKASNVPGLPLPPSFAATELVFFIEAARSCTGHHVIPRAATLPASVPCIEAMETYLGCSISIGPAPSLTLASEDADRALLSVNTEYWAQIEPGFRRQMHLQREGQTATARLHATLTEMLPAGEATVQAAASRMRLSTRSLQRFLHDEGTTFQSELDQTREALARQYLTATTMNVEEISYLLAYRDPNSFYRAFQGWTGETPGSVRARTGAGQDPKAATPQL